MQNLYFYVDDSGVLHMNEKSGYFVYAGLLFMSKDERENAKRRYISANKTLRSTLNANGELKASDLLPKHRRFLFNSIKQYESFSVSTDIRRVYYDRILSDKKSICRYKDYVLKRCVKSKIGSLIQSGIINPNMDTNIYMFVDEQNTATNGLYSLGQSIREELIHGIYNYDYGTKHLPIMNCKMKVDVQYCESKHNYLIQASDIVANRIWNSFKPGRQYLRELPNHCHLTLP